MQFRNNSTMQFLLRLLLGGVLIYAGVLKMLDAQSFADSIAGFQLVPHELINLVALSLPAFEIFLGLALVLGIRAKDAALTMACLFAVFIFVLAQAMVRGIEADCGCFGGGTSWLESLSPKVQAWFVLLRALALCLAALWLRVKKAREI